MKHGTTSGLVDAATFLSDDPALALVDADLSAWVAAHPCECEALCECDRLAKSEGTP